VGKFKIELGLRFMVPELMYEFRMSYWREIKYKINRNG